VQESDFNLMNRNNEVDNLLAQIHELQLQQAPTPAAPTKDPAPSSDVEAFKILPYLVMCVDSMYLG
jgi:hypothetical protein